jgi:serine/threonine protein kinase
VLLPVCALTARLYFDHVSDPQELPTLPDYGKVLFRPAAPVPLRCLLPHAPPAALDLLVRLLRWNPAERPSAAAALAHEFFVAAAVAGDEEQHDEREGKWGKG